MSFDADKASNQALDTDPAEIKKQGQMAAEIQNEIDDDVEDIDSLGENVEYQFDLTFYGADYPVDGLVKRLEKQDIVIPSFDPSNDLATDVEAFQRKFVWTKVQCDRFIESLLLGFPVPGIFLVKQDNKRLLVLDGQQRLLTLAAFYRGVLNKKEFALEHVQLQYRGMTYESMDEQSRRTLDDAIIHATVIRKTKNAQDLASVYSLFERLNSGGTQLSPHEIRIALAPGKLMHLIRDLNRHPAWRSVYGTPSKTLKDQELILRFVALKFWLDHYKSPMKEFLTLYAQENAQLEKQTDNEITKAFTSAIDLLYSAVGKKAFRLKTAFNAAIFDSVMVGLARRLEREEPVDEKQLAEAYAALLGNADYVAAVSKATAREDQVTTRIKLATAAFVAL